MVAALIIARKLKILAGVLCLTLIGFYLGQHDTSHLRVKSFEVVVGNEGFIVYENVESPDMNVTRSVEESEGGAEKSIGDTAQTPRKDGPSSAEEEIAVIKNMRDETEIPELNEHPAEGGGGDPNKYLINTQTCFIPVSEMWPLYYTGQWDWPDDPTPDCRDRVNLATLSQDGMFLIRNESFLNNCSLKEILRDPESDREVIYKEHGLLTETLTDVRELEHILIECSNTTFQFEATIPTKKSVEEKLVYWADKPDRPTNILVLGFDSTSRMHFLRSLPKTLKVLKELGFLDFKGQHTLEPRTTPNLIAMLLGMTEPEARATCAKDWETPFDNCPLIWKTFAERKYITVYNEDGLGTFTWDKAGFREMPTDYYIHPLLVALYDYEHGGKEQCVSQETGPAFLLRYFRRFVQKFHGQAPFFFFNFFENPFHDNYNALPSIDHDLSQTLLFLKGLPGFLENTLLIILGDHGDRYNFFSSATPDAYLERALPPLFLRIPESLLQTFPFFKSAALKNTERLTTVFDIHHTFQHILAIQEHAGHPPRFKDALPDRSSLFAPIPQTRTCDDVRVTQGYCVCNTILGTTSLDDPVVLTRLYDYALDQLNELLDNSPHEPICKTWKRSGNASSLASASVLEETERHRLVLYKFVVDPAESAFGIKIRMSKDPQNDTLVMDGQLSRINKYGDQSWCLPKVTAEDRLMREFCYCTKEKPAEEEEEGNKS